MDDSLEKKRKNELDDDRLFPKKFWSGYVTSQIGSLHDQRKSIPVLPNDETN